MADATSPEAIPVSAGKVDEALSGFQRWVTHPAFPALVAAYLGHEIIDWYKERRDARGKPSFSPATIRLLSIVTTQTLFVVTWSIMLRFANHKPWGEFDFAYGLAGSAAAIAWSHIEAWRNGGRGGGVDATPPPADPPVQ